MIILIIWKIDNMTQIKIVEEQIKLNGYISRNWCLRNYISRLSALIYDLKQEGYEFEEERVGGDYVYKFKRNVKDEVELDLATLNYKLKYI